MKSRDLERKVKKLYEDQSWLVDQAYYNVKHLPGGKIIANKVDFAHVFDLICYKQDNPILLIQVCLDTTAKAHFRKIDEQFGMHTCTYFRVMVVGVVVTKKGTRNTYSYKVYERYPEKWIAIGTIGKD